MKTVKKGWETACKKTLHIWNTGIKDYTFNKLRNNKATKRFTENWLQGVGQCSDTHSPTAAFCFILEGVAIRSQWHPQRSLGLIYMICLMINYKQKKRQLAIYKLFLDFEKRMSSYLSLLKYNMQNHKVVCVW